MTKFQKKAIVLEILFESFYNNPATIGVVKPDSKKDARFKLLLEYSYYLCEKFGEIYLSDNNKACALLLHSEKKRITFGLIYWYFILAFKVITPVRPILTCQSVHPG